MFTVGVTGTNGKSSTALLLQQVFRAAGHSTLALTTIRYGIDDRELHVPRTYEGFLSCFRQAKDAGAVHAVAELTSRALGNGYARLWRFDMGVFTNLSPDHYSTHGSWEHYLASKAQLFVALGPGRTAVLNAGDSHSELVDRVTPSDVHRRWFHVPFRGAAHHDPDLAASEVAVTPDGTIIRLQPSPWAEALGGEVRIQVIGEVFAENALAAACAGLAAEMPGEAVTRGLAECPPLPGRFQVVSRDPIVAVDYAHGPDAVARTCQTARRLAQGKVWLVLGAGGDSTPEKRKPMGKAASKGADVVIVTTDNPRHEDPKAIATALKRGCRKVDHAKVITELDRRKAIARAVSDAAPGDVVVVAGKGHETGQIVGDRVLPFSDIEEIEKLVGPTRA